MKVIVAWSIVIIVSVVAAAWEIKQLCDDLEEEWED